MKLIQNNDLKFYKFDIFEGYNIKHCFSTRLGGVSKGCYESLNLAYRQDIPENIINNYKIICSANNMDYTSTVWTKQVHTDNILTVTEKDRGRGLIFKGDEQGCDGLITNCENVVLTGFSADCVLIFLYATDVRAVGIIHSGWRGTVKEIARKGVEKICSEFGADSKNIIAGISPAIGKCCFQVDMPVVEEFLRELPWSKEFILPDKENLQKRYIDLHGINERILLNAGVRAENIENSRICTRCNSDVFFSHRAMGSERGSLAGLISL